MTAEDQIAIMSEPEFGEPPIPKTRQRAQARAQAFAPIIAALRQRPGEWARVASMPTRTARNTASNVTRGRWGFQPPGSFEERTARISDDETILWVRYMPPNPDSAAPTEAEPEPSSDPYLLSPGMVGRLCATAGCAHGPARHTADGCQRADCPCTAYTTN